MIDKVQIEVTTNCNLRCEYCLKPEKAIDIAEEIVEKLYGVAKRYVLYGFGEPMLNKNLGEFANSLDGELVLSTNAMVDEQFYEIAQLFDVVGISIDTADFRKGLVLEKAIKKLEKLESPFAQFVILEDNFQEFLALVNSLAEEGINVLATNAIAPNSTIYEKTLYFEGSRVNLDHIHLTESEIIEMIHEHFYIDPSRKEIAKKAPNFQAIIEAKQRILKAQQIEKIVDELKNSLKKGVFIEPKFFGESEGRSCPYKNSIFIRADGKVSACIGFAYEHKEFVNRRQKKVEPFVAGDLLEQEIDEVLENLREFENSRSRMDFPWCGDCAHVFGCWFLENGMDCYGNKPSCSECLYSVSIAKCLV
ncbi:MAG: radical SAM protein [Archaeoglobaceae archaeon]